MIHANIQASTSNKPTFVMVEQFQHTALYAAVYKPKRLYGLDVDKSVHFAAEDHMSDLSSSSESTANKLGKIPSMS